jgi:Transposase
VGVFLGHRTFARLDLNKLTGDLHTFISGRGNWQRTQVHHPWRWGRHHQFGGRGIHLADVGAHVSRTLNSLGHDARLVPAKYVRPYSKGQKNDFRDAEAIAEAVQRPTMKFVATKTADQLDPQALHRVWERLVNQRTGVINQIRAFLLERGIAVRQG